MTTSASPIFGSSTPPQRNLWKWIFGAAVLIAIPVLWQCGSSLYAGRKLSNTAVEEFHKKLNQAEYEVIYESSDEGLQKVGSEADLIKFLALVHTRLGLAEAANLQNVSINASFDRTLIATRYNTTFAQGSALEMFTWVKKDGVVKLLAYHVQSDKLMN